VEGEVHGGRLLAAGAVSEGVIYDGGVSKPPIFILGVPRSGTTLLRTLLDSHSNIACGPETPWLGGHQPRSVMELVRFLTEDKLGYCESFGRPREDVVGAARGFVSALMEGYSRGKGKGRWAEKTPDNVLYVDFLLEMFPEARVVWLTRAGLDVAVSTSVVAEHRRGISAFHEQNLRFGPGSAPVPNNAFNALLRWRHWNRLVGKSLHGREFLRVSYERLVTEPGETLRRVCEFVGEEFEPGMLEYSEQGHEFPEWEWGSADVRARGKIAGDRVGRGKRELPGVQLRLLEPLAQPAAAGADVEPRAALAGVGELESAEFVQLMEWINGFAAPWRLRTFTDWSKVWEYPWLWLNVFSRIRLEGARVYDLGSELSPLPWILALLGARVTLVETNRQFITRWKRLRDGLRVNVDWAIVESERIPAPDGKADLVTSFSVLEHMADKEAAIGEAARVLKPGGVLAVSCDICEPGMGMSGPEWNGRPLTIAEFERTVWGHSLFGNEGPAGLDFGRIPEFLAWHRRSASHHNYTVAAAAMVRR
jgi:protein-tyrosine sulfotransferase